MLPCNDDGHVLGVCGKAHFIAENSVTGVLCSVAVLAFQLT